MGESQANLVANLLKLRVSDNDSSNFNFQTHILSEWFWWCSLLSSLGLQVVPMEESGLSLAIKPPKERKVAGKSGGVSITKGKRELINLRCSINYDKKVASSEARGKKDIQ